MNTAKNAVELAESNHDPPKQTKLAEQSNLVEQLIQNAMLLKASFNATAGRTDVEPETACVHCGKSDASKNQRPASENLHEELVRENKALQEQIRELQKPIAQLKEDKKEPEPQQPGLETYADQILAHLQDLSQLKQSEQASTKSLKLRNDMLKVQNAALRTKQDERKGLCDTLHQKLRDVFAKHYIEIKPLTDESACFDILERLQAINNVSTVSRSTTDNEQSSITWLESRGLQLLDKAKSSEQHTNPYHRSHYQPRAWSNSCQSSVQPNNLEEGLDEGLASRVAVRPPKFSIEREYLRPTKSRERLYQG